MSTSSRTNTPASSRSSKIPTTLTSSPNPIHAYPALPSATATPDSKGSTDRTIDHNAAGPGSRSSKRIFSDSSKGRFDLRGRLPGNRDSGGFLLEPLSAFTKRKRSNEEPLTNQSSNSNPSGTTGSSSSIFTFADGHGTPTPYMKGKGRASPSSDQAGASLRTTPASVAFGRNDSTEWSNHSHRDVIDPTQIVQMALSLSESRRLSLSPGHLAPATVSGNRRTVSAGYAPSSLRWQGDNLSKGVEYGLGNVSASQQNHDTIVPKKSIDRSAISSMRQSALQTGGIEDTLSFSAATLSRAKNAKMYFELAHEYRRLLGFLPPLKQDAEASALQKLGRAYNPLQYIRNRQVRTRERQTLDVNGAGWNNIEAVRLWIDTVEIDSRNTENRSGDVLLLPPWNQKLRTSGVQSSAPWLPPAQSDVVTNSSRAKWAKLDWSVTPSDMLADAYWLEQGRNKALIEAQDGGRIYTKSKWPRDNRLSGEKSRKSLEVPNGRLSNAHDTPEPLRHSQSKSSPSGRISNTIDRAELKNSPSPPPKKSKGIARVKRHLLRRHKEDADMSADSDASDVDHLDLEDFEKRGPMPYENTGPLEKHMNKMLELESRAKFNRPRRLSSVETTQHRRRGGVSTDNTADSEYELQRSSTDMISNRPSSEANNIGTPRISIEDTDAADGSLSRETTASFDDEPIDAKLEDHLVTRRSQSSRFNFFRMPSKVKERENIEVTDFATIHQDERIRNSLSPVRSDDSPRSSIEMAGRTNSFRSLNFLHLQREVRSKSQDDLSKLADQAQTNSATTKFFKGGRIGEIVRSERPRTGGFVWKRKAPRQGSAESNQADNSVSESDDDENHQPQEANELDDGRSRSTSDLNQNNYRVKELPAFKPALARGATKDGDVGKMRHDDHISRQAQAQRVQNRRSRFDRMAPLSVKTSRATSPTILSRRSTNDTRSNQDRDRSPGDNRSSSRSRSGLRASDKRLNAVLRDPGGVGKGGLPVTGLAAVDARRRSRSARPDGHRHWSIADDAARPDMRSATTVTPREIAYVRSLLLASGIKANAIVLKANEPREIVPDFLIQAAKLSNTALGNVGRRQEHVLAARMLSRNLETTISAFEKAAEHFRGETCMQLHSRIDDLREQVGSKLTPLVRSCGDDADAFIAQLTTTHTLAIKQVNDSVELMMRSRRRRLRWLRKAGFALLEWVLVGLMWWIWLFVYVLKLFRGFFVGCWRVVRWVSWN